MRQAATILGVQPTDSVDRAKAAWKSLSLRYHPDKNSDSDAAERFREVHAAFQRFKECRESAAPDASASSAPAASWTSPARAAQRTPASRPAEPKEDLQASSQRLPAKRCNDCGEPKAEWVAGMLFLCKVCQKKRREDEIRLAESKAAKPQHVGSSQTKWQKRQQNNGSNVKAKMSADEEWKEWQREARQERLATQKDRQKLKKLLKRQRKEKNTVARKSITEEILRLKAKAAKGAKGAKGNDGRGKGDAKGIPNNSKGSASGGKGTDWGSASGGKGKDWGSASGHKGKDRASAKASFDGRAVASDPYTAAPAEQSGAERLAALLHPERAPAELRPTPPKAPPPAHCFLRAGSKDPKGDEEGERAAKVARTSTEEGHGFWSKLAEDWDDVSSGPEEEDGPEEVDEEQEKEEENSRSVWSKWADDSDSGSGDAEDQSSEDGPAGKEKDAPLPDGWRMVESRSNPGTFYYFCQESGVSQVERPVL